MVGLKNRLCDLTKWSVKRKVSCNGEKKNISINLFGIQIEIVQTEE